MTLNPKIGVYSDCLVIFGCRRVNCYKLDGDRPRIPANRNCYRLSRISWALAENFCYSICINEFLLEVYYLHQLVSFCSLSEVYIGYKDMVVQV